MSQEPISELATRFDAAQDNLRIALANTQHAGRRALIDNLLCVGEDLSFEVQRLGAPASGAETQLPGIIRYCELAEELVN